MLSFALGLAAELIAPSRCAACAERVGYRRAFCPPCARTVEPSPRDTSCVAMALYGGAVARAVARFKYEGAVDAGRVLGELFSQLAPALADEHIDVVVPVPLHPNRLASRGFNQAALLARPLAKALAVDFAPRALGRSRDTARQVGLPRAERLRNVAGAFVAHAPNALRGRTVLLVDDVYTSGATLAACETTLRAAGAARVLAGVVARAAGASAALEADFSSAASKIVLPRTRR